MAFSPVLTAQLQEIMPAYPHLNMPALVAGLVEAAAEDQKEANTTAPPAPVAALKAKGAPFAARPEQALFYMHLYKGLELDKPFDPAKEFAAGEPRSGPVVIAEASTGIGKGRALMAIAVEAAALGRTPVIVAAPTLQVMGQLWAELQELQKEGVGAETSAMIFPGASEFVDDLKLKEWFSHPENVEAEPALAHWVATGGPRMGSNAVADAAHSLGVNLHWLAEDMSRAAVNFDESAFILRHTKEDKITSESRTLLSKIRACARDRIEFPEDTNLQAQAKALPGAQILICSHMMLALGQKTMWRALPAPTTLLIDEAHALEETIARVNSEQISLFSLRYRLNRMCSSGTERKLGKGTVARMALARTRDLIKKLQAISGTDRIKIDFASEAPELRAITDDIEELARALASKVFKDQKDIREIGAQLKYAVTCLSVSKNPNRTDIVLYLEFSPTRRYPSILVGACNIAKQANSLWATARAGSALVSATLYIEDTQGNQKCDYISRNLSLPLSRIKTPLPVIASHLYTIPTLHIPSAAKRPLLTRPPKAVVDAQPEAMDKWMFNLAQEIIGITKDATGGSLVLTTSYQQIEAITGYVRELDPVVYKRMIAPTRNQKFAKVIEAFIGRHALGHHPILIALGPAWTGLNMQQNTANPEDDTLLSHLIIACCPIGLNRTPTMQRRIEKSYTLAIAQEALISLKQGLGRLIRRKDVKHRNIYVLDARIWSLIWFPAFCMGARKMLSKYKTTREF